MTLERFVMCRSTFRWLALVLGVALVTIFAASILAQNSSVPALPQSAGPARPPDLPSYKIQVNDILKIFVWRDAALSQDKILVRPDGRISMPLISDMQAAGLTPVELKQKIEEELLQNINAPNVTVIVDSINSYQIYVMGNVANGGAIKSTTPLNVMQALANAGGFRDFADKKDVNIFRGNLLFRFNYEEFIKGRNLSQNIFLEAGDVVEVH